jgi:hypothetical protein
MRSIVALNSNVYAWCIAAQGVAKLLTSALKLASPSARTDWKMLPGQLVVV